MTAVGAIIRLLGASRATIYKYVPEVTTGRAAAALPSEGVAARVTWHLTLRPLADNGRTGARRFSGR